MFDAISDKLKDNLNFYKIEAIGLWEDKLYFRAWPTEDSCYLSVILANKDDIYIGPIPEELEEKIIAYNEKEKGAIAVINSIIDDILNSTSAEKNSVR